MQKTITLTGTCVANADYFRVTHLVEDPPGSGTYYEIVEERYLYGSAQATLAGWPQRLYLWWVTGDGPVLNCSFMPPVEGMVSHSFSFPDNPIGIDGSWSLSGSGTYELELNFDVEMDVLASAEMKSSFHRGYSVDWNPYDRTPDIVGPIHTLTGATARVTVSAGGDAWTKTVDVTNGFEENFGRYGLIGVFSGAISANVGAGTYADLIEAGSVYGGGFPASIPEGSLSDSNSYLEYGGARATLFAKTSAGGSISIGTCPYTVNYSGYIKNIDGTVPSTAATINTTDDVTDSTDGNGQFSASKSYDGQYQIYLNGAPLIVNDLGPVYEIGGTYMMLLHAWIDNCREMGEPEFPWSGETGESYPNTDGTNDYSDSWFGASDKRLTIDNDYYNITDAVTFSAPTSKTLVPVFSASDWTVIEGVATITATTGGIQVEVTQAPCRIKKAHTITCAGARYADLLFTSDLAGDTDKIDVYLAARRFEISPDNCEIDLIAPEDIAPAVDTSQTAWDGSPTWGWGVHDVGDIEFGNLQSDRVYTFKSLIIKRKSEFRVVLDGGTGARKTGTAGTTNSLGGPYVDGETYYSRTGYVLVDGIVAAEIFGMTHYTIPSVSGPVWKHITEKISTLTSTPTLHPANGMVTCSYPNEHAGNCFIIYLDRGTHTSEGGEVSISAHGAGSSIAVPFNYAEYPQASINKTLRAKALVRAIRKNGDVTSCTLRKYDRVSGDVLSEQTLNLSDAGTFTPALQCPTTDAGVITSVTDSTHFVVSGLSKDYTGYTCYLLSGGSGETYYLYPQSNTILSHNTATGAIVLANALTGAQPDAGQKFWVHLDYRYELIFPGGHLLCNTNGELLSDAETGELLTAALNGPAAVAPRNTTFITALVD